MASKLGQIIVAGKPTQLEFNLSQHLAKSQLNNKVNHQKGYLNLIYLGLI